MRGGPRIARPAAVGRHGVDVGVDQRARRAPAREHVGAAAGRRCAAGLDDHDLVGAARAQQRREVLAQRPLVAGGARRPTAAGSGNATSSASSAATGDAVIRRVMPSGHQTRKASCRRDLRQRRREQRLARLGAVPGRRARRVRQRRSRRARRRGAARGGARRRPRSAGRRRAAAARSRACRPGCTSCGRSIATSAARWRLQRVDLVGRRHAVAALAALAGKAAAHRGHVDAAGGTPSSSMPMLGEPAEQGLAGGPRERPAERAPRAARAPGRSASPATARRPPDTTGPIMSGQRGTARSAATCPSSWTRRRRRTITRRSYATRGRRRIGRATTRARPRRRVRYSDRDRNALPTTSI